MADIALVGLGNLGSRHLQGLARAETPLRIRLIDPSENSIRIATERWREAGGDEGPHILLAEDPGAYDLAIVATTADHRTAAVEALAARAEVAAWILEKPLGQAAADIDRMAAHVGPRCWVNTARREMAWHRQIAGEVSVGDGPLDVIVEGGPWGLAGNAIHFIDLVTWWSGSEAVEIDASGLDPHWHASKRSGYSEIFGRLRIRYGDGSSLTLISTAKGGPHSISVATDAGRWIIEEGSGRCERPDGTVLNGKIEYQSELTGRLADTMVAGGSPALPPLGAIASAERRLLAALTPHRMAAGGPPDRLDIT